MKVLTIGGKDYRLPNSLNDFQRDMYVHLVNWKWEHITKEPGRDRGLEYDAILPDAYRDSYAVLHSSLREAVKAHKLEFPFRTHEYFNHMASSQAANINLFLPILLDPKANSILGALKPDLAAVASSELDNGYRIEFWDEPFGTLGDKTPVSGTDSDIAIAYRNHEGELCLWLIEHKLTEPEFTTCGGFRSRGRQKRHDCDRSFADIVKDKRLCYYHDVRKFNYWDITEVNEHFFANHANHDRCPFRGGMNQLWRNQLLGLGIEQDARQPYKHVTFSVVKHSGNKHLDPTLGAYKDLIADNPKFSVFTSADVVDAAARFAGEGLGSWIAWYRDLYYL